MKAVVFHEFGGGDVLQLEEVPDPRPGRGEVLIDVAACALNHLDVDVREGISRFPVEPPFVLGIEVVGRIAQLGEGVEGWQVGERVMPFLMAMCGECLFCRTGRESLCTAAGFISFTTSGGYAEQLVCPVEHLLRVPDELADEAAAALQVAFGTAWHMLFTRGRRDLSEGAQLLDAAHGSDGRILRRRRDLVHEHAPGLVVDVDEVGEGAADVDAESLHRDPPFTA